MQFHSDPIVRETAIAKYLARKADSDLSEEFDAHYLACDDCFEELRAAQLLICGLGLMLERVQSQDVTVIRFTQTAQLTAASLDLSALARTIPVQNDTKVLIDLSKVSRIDSAGLGMLMNCYCHAVKNDGILKLLNPSAQVKKILTMTKIDSVLQTFEDERAALRSFADTGS